MVRQLIGGLAFGSMLILFGCSFPAEPTPEEVETYHDELLQIAQEYKSWDRADKEFRWALADCRMPPPAQPRFSASSDTETHGQKLYSLFAKDAASYNSIAQLKSAKVGQVIVKESWVPEETQEVKAGPPDWGRVIRTGSAQRRENYYPYATKDDKVYKASKPAGLFIMMKVDPATPGTDDGWVYGTVTADGKSVTAAGTLDSCMKCHRDAPHDRLFGVPKE